MKAKKKNGWCQTNAWIKIERIRGNNMKKNY